MGLTYICRLFFQNGLHVGAARQGVGLESSDGPTIRSDTLWAALCNHWALMGRVGNIAFKEFLDSYQSGQPLFLLSSAFPFTDDNYYWLPRPLVDPLLLKPGGADAYHYRLAYGPAIKKRSFVRMDHWVLWNRETLDLGELTHIHEMDQFGDTLRPHNTLDRVTGQSTLFHAGLTYFDPSSSGLYFLLRLESEQVLTAVEILLEVIKATAGFGGNVNSGSGALERFELFPAGDNWAGVDESPKDADLCLLSLYHPRSIDNAAGHAVAYELVQRKGWTGSLTTGRQAKYKTFCMFAEGSVFSGHRPVGRLVPVTPENLTPTFPHDVFRNGMAVTFPLPAEFKDDDHV